MEKVQEVTNKHARRDSLWHLDRLKKPQASRKARGLL